MDTNGHEWLKFRIRVYSCSFVVLFSFSAFGQQLKNPSFEAPADKKKPHGELAADWGRWGAYLNREDAWDSPHNGKCMLAYHHWQILDNESSGVYQDVEKSDPNVAYEFSVYVFIDPDTNADNIELRIEKLWGNGPVAAKKYYLGSIESKSWKRINVEGVPAEPGLRATLVVTPAQNKARNGAVKFDDARLSKKGS
jgi:hypothetical protein